MSHTTLLAIRALRAQKRLPPRISQCPDLCLRAPLSLILFLNAISIPDITTGHSNRVFSLKFVAEDPNLLVSGGWDNTVQVWDVRAGLSEPLTNMLKGSSECMLRVIHYPALAGIEVEEGAVRAAAHEDINLITLLLAGSAPGLEAQDQTGAWHQVPCDRGMIVVNAGDMLQLASGGAFPSTTHRVVNPADVRTGGARFSMPMFVHPRPEVALSKDKTAGAYLHERLVEIGLAS